MRFEKIGVMPRLGPICQGTAMLQSYDDRRSFEFSSGISNRYRSFYAEFQNVELQTLSNSR